MSVPDLDTLTSAELAALLAAVAARLLALPDKDKEPDRLLKPREAAAILAVSPEWLYRNAEDLPFTVRLSGNVRFSMHGIQRYLDSQRAS